MQIRMHMATTIGQENYLIDNQGYICYSHIGEGGYDQTEQMIRTLLAEGVIP
jgi:hypothetical protein